MADKFRKTVPLKISFANGEQPTAAKLTAIAEQLRLGTNLLEYAIGDLWNESGDVNLDNLELQIPNIARMIGQNKLLNPALYYIADFDFYDHVGARHQNQNTGYLLFHNGIYGNSTPTVETAGNIVGTITDDPTSVDYNTQNCSIDLDKNEVTIQHNSGFSGTEVVKYHVYPNAWLSGMEFVPGVIPDPRAISFTGCRISKTGSTYYLHLPPRVRLSISNYEKPHHYPNADELTDANNIGTASDNGTTYPYKMFHPESGNALRISQYRYRFPDEIEDILWSLTPVTGQLPEGLLYLWDNNTNTIVRDVKFYRSDKATYNEYRWTLIITSTTTDFEPSVTSTEALSSYNNSKYSLICVGSSIANTLKTLYKSATTHSHDNWVDGSALVQHKDLAYRETQSSETGKAFGPSYWDSDNHLSLLHRGGSNTTQNRDMNHNAMLGDLCLAGSTMTVSGSYMRTDVASNKLLFGHSNTNTAPAIWHDGSDIQVRSDNNLLFTSGNVGIGEETPLGKIHIKTGDAGSISPNSYADDMIIETSFDGGMTIYNGITSSGWMLFGNSTYDRAGGVLYEHDTDNLSLWAKNSQRFVINADNNYILAPHSFLVLGNVGVGVSTPLHKVHIEDDTSGTSVKIENTQTTYSNADPVLYVKQSGDTSHDNSIGMFGVGNSSDSGNDGNLFRVTQTGNVGVGVITPTEKLDVDGNINCDAYKCDQSVTIPFTPLNAVRSAGTLTFSVGMPRLTISASAGKILIPLVLPASGTVTAARLRIRGDSSHSYSIALSKDDISGSIDIPTNTTMASLTETTADISATAGVIKSLTVTGDNTYTSSDIIYLYVTNNDATSDLYIGIGDITVTLNDVTTNKAG